jgi:hypothetical protein
MLNVIALKYTHLTKNVLITYAGRQLQRNTDNEIIVRGFENISPGYIYLQNFLKPPKVALRQYL